MRMPLARSISARRPNAPSRSWYSANRRSTMSIELCQSSTSASVMCAKTPRLEASLTNPGSGAWISAITGQVASRTILSIIASACSEFVPSPTSATSGRSLAVASPRSSTWISRAITSCPSATTIGATRASRSCRSLAIRTRRWSVSRYLIACASGADLRSVAERPHPFPRAPRACVWLGGSASRPRRATLSGSDPRPAHGARSMAIGRATHALGVRMPPSSKHSHQSAARIAAWSGRHRKKAIWGWLAFVLVVFALGNAAGTTNISDVDQFSGESHRAEAALDRAGMRPVEEVVLIQSTKLTAKDAEFRAAVGEVTARLSKLQYVEDVRSPLAEGGNVAAGGHAALVNFNIAGDSTEAKDRVDPSLAATAAVQARHPNLVVEQSGGASGAKAINATITDDLKKAGELSLPVTLIILTLTFGTLVAAGLPLLIGITAVMAALGLIALPSSILPVDANLPAVVLLIGLAVGVDYSLFYLRREREERAAGRTARSALETAAATSGRAVLISGVTVMVAMAGMFISGDKSFISFAEGAILVVAIAVFASLTVLPAMLSWLGDRIERGRVPIVGRRRRPAGSSRFWTALTSRVMRRPVVAIVLAGGLLVVLAIPALQMKAVTSGVNDLPQDIPVIATYNKIKAVFPAEGVTALVVVEAGNVRTGAAAAGI